MGEFGTRADLARRLGISKSAVTQALKKHGFQNTLDKKFDLDYYEFLLKQKQEQSRVIGQRNRKEGPVFKQQRPKVVRAVYNQLATVFNDAFELFIVTMHKDYETSEDEIQNHLDVIFIYFFMIKEAFNKAYPPDLADSRLKNPMLMDEVLSDEYKGNTLPFIREILKNHQEAIDHDPANNA